MDLSFKSFKDSLSYQIKKDYYLNIDYSLNKVMIESFSIDDSYFNDSSNTYDMSLKLPELKYDSYYPLEYKIENLDFIGINYDTRDFYYNNLSKEHEFDYTYAENSLLNSLKESNSDYTNLNNLSDLKYLLDNKIDLNPENNIAIKNRMLSDSDLHNIETSNETDLAYLSNERKNQLINDKSSIKDKLEDQSLDIKEGFNKVFEYKEYKPENLAFNMDSIYYKNEKFDEKIAQIAPPKLTFGNDYQSPAFHRGVHSIYDKYLNHKYKTSESIFIDAMAGGFLNSTISSSVAFGYNRNGNTYSLYLEKSQWLDTKTNTGKMIESAGLELCPDLSFGMRIIQFKPCYKFVNGMGTFKERDPFGNIAVVRKNRSSIRLYGRWILSVPDNFDKYFKEGLTRDIVSTEVEGYSGFSDDPFLWGWFGGITFRTPMSGLSMNFENYMGQRFVFGVGYVWGKVL